MSTQTLQRVDSIAHLDHEVKCQSSVHRGNPPKATHWYNQHGCWDQFWCGVCVDKHIRRCENHLRSGGGRRFECTICDANFTSVEALFTVVPL